MARRALLAAALLVASPLLAQDALPPGLHGEEKLAALVQRVSQVQASLTTLKAAFEQRRTSKLLAEPSVSRGTFYYQAPDSVRWEYESPRPMTVLLAGGVAITYRPAEKRAERVEVGRAQRRVFRFISAAEPLEKLKAYFSFTFRDAGGASDYQLELRPTTHVIRKRLKQLDIGIDRRTLLPVRVAYVETDGDGTEYAFSNVETNTRLAADLFNLTLPADVKVVSLKLGSGE